MPFHLPPWLDRLKRPKVLLALCAIFFALPLGSRALWDPVEGRFAEVAREMITLKSWLVPTLNHVVFFDHPPLTYWLTALTMKVGGLNEWTARLGGAVFGVLTVALTAFIARRWRGHRAGLLAGGIVATSGLFFAMTQYLSGDIVLTFWTTLTLYGLSRISEEREPDRLKRFATLACLGAAGGLMTQGPLAVILPAIAFLGGLILSGQGAQLRKTSWKGGAILFIVLALPWFLLMSVREASFVPTFFVQEPIARLVARPPHDPMPIYFYLLAIPIGFLPWTVFAPALRGWVGRTNPAVRREPVAALMITWIVVFVVVASLFRAKGVGSILPIFPALAVLFGAAFDEALSDREMPAWMSYGIAALIIVFMTMLWMLKTPHPPAFLRSGAGVAVVSGGGLVSLVIAFGIFLLVGVWGMRGPRLCFAGVVATQVLFLLSLTSVAKLLDPYLSGKGLAMVLEERAEPSGRLVAYKTSYDDLASLAFYSRRRVAIFGPAGTLAVGRDRDPEAAQWFADGADADAALRREPPGTWGVTHDNAWPSLEAAYPNETLLAVARQRSLRLFQKQE